MYQYCENNRVVSFSTNFLTMLHELVMQAEKDVTMLKRTSALSNISKHTLFDYLTIVCMIGNDEFKKLHPFIVETCVLTYDMKFVINETYTYDLTSIVSCLDLLRNRLSEKAFSTCCNTHSNNGLILNSIIMSAKRISSMFTQESPNHIFIAPVQNIANEPIVQQPIPTKSSTKPATITDVVLSANKLIQNISDSNSKMEKTVLFAKKPEESDNDSDDSDDSDDDDSDNNNDNNENDDEFPDDMSQLSEAIKQLEKVQESLENKIMLEKEVLDSEKDNCANYECKLKFDRQTEKIMNERQQQDKNIYEHDKSFAYPKVLKRFLKGKFGEGDERWGNLPPLFLVRFPTLLFMDGRDTDGKQIKPSLFERTDDYEIYNTLVSSLCDEEFIMPKDNIEYMQLIDQFIDQLPPIELITSDDIMTSLNENDDNPIFKEEECSEDECESDDENVPSDMKGNNGRKANNAYCQM
jgi:hypothetical protein